MMFLTTFTPVRPKFANVLKSFDPEVETTEFFLKLESLENGMVSFDIEKSQLRPSQKFKNLIFKLQYFTVLPLAISCMLLYILQFDMDLAIEKISGRFPILLGDIACIAELRERLLFIFNVEMNLICVINVIYFMPELFNFDSL